MIYQVRLSDRTMGKVKSLRAFERAAVLDRIRTILTSTPTVTGKSRIKVLRQPAPTQYRLRVDDFRVFYNVDGDVVNVIDVLSKAESLEYLGGET
jgi:mRNA interferase RelE/StbE